MDYRIVTCQHCGTRLSLPANKGRLLVTCPKCNYKFHVDSGPIPAANGTPPPAQPRQSPQPAAASTPSGAQAKQEPKKSSDFLYFVLLCVVIYFVVRGCGSEKQTSPQSVPTETVQSAYSIHIPDGVPVIVEAQAPDDGSSETAEEHYRRKLEFYRQLDEAIQNLEPQVYLISSDPISYDTLGEAFGYPYFWIDSLSRSETMIGTWEGETRSYRVCNFTYKKDTDQRAAMQAEIDAAAAEYMRLIPASADRWDASKIVHDELIRRVTYDHSLSGEHIYDIYGPLVQGSSVCQGYAYAFSYLMNRWETMTGKLAFEGCNSYPVAAQSGTHGWNIISGAPDSNLDVTWDDPDTYDRYGNPYILYNYFGLSKTEIETVDSHTADGFNRAFDLLPHDGKESFNYHKHEGYYLNEFDLNRITSIFAQQFNSGSNILTVKFENQADYERVLLWKDSNRQELYDILLRIGYNDWYYLFTWDELRTVTIELYPNV